MLTDEKIREALFSKGWESVTTYDILAYRLGVEAERKRCAGVCRTIAARYEQVDVECAACQGTAKECAQAIERGEDA